MPQWPCKPAASIVWLYAQSGERPDRQSGYGSPQAHGGDKYPIKVLELNRHEGLVRTVSVTIWPYYI